MKKFLLFTFKITGFILSVAGFLGVLAGIYGLFNHDLGDNRAPIFIFVGLLLIALGLVITYSVVKRDKKELLGVLFNDLFISLLWPW